MTEDQRRTVVDGTIERVWRLKEFVNAIYQLEFDLEETLTVTHIVPVTSGDGRQAFYVLVDIPLQEPDEPGDMPEIEQAVHDIVQHCNRNGP